tara:strand:+ start:30443 stop:31264 length:822 start_codon:yes stop_codon:yes gene_type:complete
MNFKKTFKKSLIIIGSSIVLLSSSISLYENLSEKKGKIKILLSNSIEKIVKITNDTSNNENSKIVTKILNPDQYWAKELKKGGYILYMRHAKRDKWEDVAMYDSAEAKLFKSNNSAKSYGENTYYADGVCLNSKGKIQSRMIKEKIIESEIPIGYVISSPSCRARQTAILAFGKHDELNEVFFHKNIFNEIYNNWQANLKEAFLNAPLIKGKNTIITAHGSTVGKNLFKNSNNIKKLRLKQGGFFIISKNKGELILEHQFTKFENFSKVFSIR